MDCKKSFICIVKITFLIVSISLTLKGVRYIFDLDYPPKSWRQGTAQEKFAYQAVGAARAVMATSPFDTSRFRIVIIRPVNGLLCESTTNEGYDTKYEAIIQRYTLQGIPSQRISIRCDGARFLK